jgi:hypothetical protein
LIAFLCRNAPQGFFRSITSLQGFLCFAFNLRYLRSRQKNIVGVRQAQSLIGGKMKSLFFTIALVFSAQAVANSKSAERLVLTEINQYANYYQIEELETMKFNGMIRNKYSFSFLYKTSFCRDIGDDERAYCATYRCLGAAEVDGDAVVSLTVENDVKKCSKIPNTDFTRLW